MQNPVFQVGHHVLRHLTLSLALPVALAFCLTLSCSSGGSSGGSEAELDNVTLFTPADAITPVTGADTVEPTSLNPTSDGLFLMVDGASGSVLLFNQRGQFSIFTSQEELQDLLGGPAALGKLDEILLGAQARHFLGVDEISGLLIRLEPDGTPVIHATEEQITAFTGRNSARMSLPRFLLPGANISQELVTRDILQIGNSGAAITLFVSAVNLSVVAGVLPQNAIVAEWARGGGTRSLFARFDTTNNIVKIEENGTATRHVEGNFLQTLFPEISDLHVAGLIAETSSDTLLLLIADGERGVALAGVQGSPPFTVSVFTSEEQFEEVLGIGYNISQIGRLAGSDIPFAIDHGGSRVLTFGNVGQPIVVAPSEAIGRESQTDTPRISIGVELGEFAVIVPEDTTGDLIQVQ